MFSRWFAAVAAAILAAVEGGILPPGMATLNEELTTKPTRESAGQDARLYGRRDARRYAKQIQRFIAGFGRAGDMRPGGTKEGSFLHRWLIAVTLSSLPDFEPLGRVPQR